MNDLISRQVLLAEKFASLECALQANRDANFDVYKLGWNEALQTVYDNAPSAQQWIPCSERLPEKSGKYLVSCKANAYSNITTTAQWQNRYKYWYMTGARSHWRVDAWMPLPEPYKGEKE